MTIGYFAPLPPGRSGVAEYAAALLERMPEARVDRDGDVNLYQLGNNQLHRDIYRRAMAGPGVVLLHDAVLQHFFLGSLTESEYVNEFVYNYGEWSRDLGRDLWRNRARSGSDARYFEYPMLRRVAETSLAVIVHNPAAAEAVRRHSRHRATPLEIVEIPHLYVPPADPPATYEIVRLREELGFGARTSVFAVFGYLRESKRLINILRAFDAIRGQADVGLLIAGEFVSPDLERAAEPLLAKPGIVRIPYLSERDFWLHAAAIDVCLNLRYPTAAETSGIGVRLMGIGKPVLFTAGDELRSIPDSACVRVDGGPGEVAMISRMMSWLAHYPVDAREIGRRAANQIATHHDASHCAEAFSKTCHNALAQKLKNNKAETAPCA